MISIKQSTNHQQSLAYRRIARMRLSLLEIKHNLILPNDICQYISGVELLLNKVLDSMKEFNKQERKNNI